MDSWKTKLLPHLIALGVFFVVVFVFCAPAFQGKSIKAHDTKMHKGLSKAIVDHREDFQEEPLWTNNVFGGMPAFQISVLYPKNLIKYLDVLPRTIGLPNSAAIILKYLIGFYILLLALKVPYKYAIPGAIAFALSSYLLIILQAGHNTKANAISYVAPAVAGILLTYRGKYLLGGAITALFFSLNLVANHVQITYYIGLSLLILGVVEAVKQIKGGQLKHFLTASAVAVAAVFAAVLVNNTNLRLTADYVKDTQRGKSELAIKERQKQEQAAVAEKQRIAAIEQAKEKAANDDSFVFSEADFLPPAKAYATMWSYGKLETFTLLSANFNGGGSADAYEYLFDESAFVDDIKKQMRGSSKSAIKKTSKEQFENVARAYYWGDQPGVNGPVYIGSGLVLLFLLGLFAVKSHLKWWLLGTAALGVFIAWGKNFLPFFNFMFDYFPAYNKFRAVTMALYLTEFAVPVLGFLFIKEVVKGEIEKPKAMTALKFVGGGFVAVLSVMYLFASQLFSFEGSVDVNIPASMIDFVKEDRLILFKKDLLMALLFTLATAGVVYAIINEKLKSTIAAVLLGLIVFGDLFIVDTRYFNESIFERSKKVVTPFDQIDPSKDLLKKDQGSYRVYSAYLGRSGATQDASTAYFHQDIGGYASVKLMIYQDLLDFTLGREMDLVSNNTNQVIRQNPALFNNPMAMQQFSNSLFVNTPVMNMLNTKYVFAHPQAPYLINNNALGNAWLVKQVLAKPSADSVLFNLTEVDLKTTALSESTENKLGFSGEGSVKLIESKANHLKYTFSSATQQFVVFSEVYYKGWNAYVNGELVPHEKVNYILRGLQMPAGQHEIEFKFEPPLYAQGENISLAASLLVILLFGFAIYQEVKKKKLQAA